MDGKQVIDHAAATIIGACRHNKCAILITHNGIKTIPYKEMGYEPRDLFPYAASMDPILAAQAKQPRAKHPRQKREHQGVDGRGRGSLCACGCGTRAHHKRMTVGACGKRYLPGHAPGANQAKLFVVKDILPDGEFSIGVAPDSETTGPTE